MSLVVLGFNQVKVAIILELARAGGSASTSHLARAIQPDGPNGQIPRMTVLRHLRALQELGYVSTEEPTREGATTVWVFHAERLHDDLHRFIAESTPHH